MSESAVPLSMTQLSIDSNTRPRYTQSELQEYFERITLDKKYLDSPVLSDTKEASKKEHGLPFLQALTRFHTCNVAFENLELHYSPHKTITLDPAALYTKIVRHRRGGRCMENNTFFATVLRSLGYRVRNCAGRVSRSMSPYPDVRKHQAHTYDGWNHMLNLVRLDDEWFVVDVGMGAMGPNLPYPLRDGFQTTSIAPRQIRLQLRAIPESYGDGENKLWCYDVCLNPDAEEQVWTPTYCFATTEFLPQDYEMMSWFTSTSPRSFFTRAVMCTRMCMDEDREVIVGNVTLYEGTVTRNVGMVREVVRECGSEEDRVGALEEFFGVVLDEGQRNGIEDGLRLGS